MLPGQHCKSGMPLFITTTFRVRVQHPKQLTIQQAFKMEAVGGVAMDFCSLCRANYDENKSHVYTKKHKDVVTKLLDRFLVKVKEATSTIAHPRIKEPGFEESVNIWCYFCESDVKKHSICEEHDFVCCHGGTLLHLKSKDHLKNCKKFWWANRIDASKMEAFIVTSENYTSFQTNAKCALDEFAKEHFLVRHKLASSIRCVEAERRLVAQIDQPTEPQLKPPNGNDICQASTSGSSAHNQSGARMLPPWLQPDDDEPGTSREVGPSMQDYQRHLDQLKKRKLPANRVGANFDRSAANTVDWLPSFGRVWNNGRRSASKKEFDRNRKPYQRRQHGNDKTEIRPYQPKSNSAPNLKKYEL